MRRWGIVSSQRRLRDVSALKGERVPLGNVAGGEIGYDGALYKNFGEGVYRDRTGRVFEWLRRCRVNCAI